MMNIENKKKAIYYKVTKRQALLWIYLLSFVYSTKTLINGICLDFFYALKDFLDFN